MWNPFKKQQKANDNSGQRGLAQSTSPSNGKSGAQTPSSASPQDANGNVMGNMNMLQKLAMKKLMSMSEQERQQLMSKFMTPENIEKNKDKILAQMDQMKKSGMITESQYEEGKKRLGL